MCPGVSAASSSTLGGRGCVQSYCSILYVCMKSVLVDRIPAFGWRITVFLCKCPCMICIAYPLSSTPGPISPSLTFLLLFTLLPLLFLDPLSPCPYFFFQSHPSIHHPHIYLLLLTSYFFTETSSYLLTSCP